MPLPVFSRMASGIRVALETPWRSLDAKRTNRAGTREHHKLAGDATAAETDRERVAQRAYELYLERGAGQGHDLDDWLSAEREVTGGTRTSSGDSPGE
jgi:hypothetical protein